MNLIGLHELSILFSQWVGDPPKEPSTVAAYLSAWRCWSRYVAALDGAGPMDRQQFLNWLLFLRRKYRASTYYRYARLLRSFFLWTASHGTFLDIAVDTKVSSLPHSTTKRGIFSRKQVTHLLSVLQAAGSWKVRDFNMLWLMGSTGIRRCEVCRANCDDLSMMGDKYILWIQGKGSPEPNDVVFLSPELFNSLSYYISWRKPRGLVPLFTQGKNPFQRLSPRSVYNIVKTALELAVMPSVNFSPHSFRYTAAFLAREAGEDLRSIQQMLRHRDPKTTSGYLTMFDRLQSPAELSINLNPQPFHQLSIFPGGTHVSKSSA